MSTLPEQFSAASKSQIQAQLDFIESFGARAFDSAARLIALNIDTGRAAVDSSSAALKQLATIRDPRDLLAMTKDTQDFSKIVAYGSEWLSIVADMQAGLFKSVAPAALAVAPQAAPVPAPNAAPAPVPAPQVEAVAAPAPAAQVEAVAAPAPQAAAEAAAPQAPPPASNEEQARPVKPSKKPVVAVKAEAAPAPVAEAKPIAKAAGKVAGKPIAAKPAAAPLASDGAQVLPQLKPAKAGPPPAVFHQDLLTPKRGKKR